MAKRPGAPGSPERKAAYRREYEKRIALGEARGLSRKRSVGKRNRGEPTLGLMGWDLRFSTVWDKLKKLILPDAPLDEGTDSTSISGKPTGVSHVIMFIGASDAVAIYPDGRRERGSIDQVWRNAKDSGLATEVSTDEPPPRTLRPCYATEKPTKSSAVHYGEDDPDSPGWEGITLCGREAMLLTDRPVTCRKCLTENAKERSL